MIQIVCIATLEAIMMDKSVKIALNFNTVHPAQKINVIVVQVKISLLLMVSVLNAVLRLVGANTAKAHTAINANLGTN